MEKVSDTNLKLPKFLSSDFHILKYLMENSRTDFSAGMNRHGNPYAVVMTIDGVATFLSNKNKIEFMSDPNYLSCFG